MDPRGRGGDGGEDGERHAAPRSARAATRRGAAMTDFTLSARRRIALPPRKDATDPGRD